jgi:glutathione S-transferase
LNFISWIVGLSAKVRFYLAEKDLPWDGHYIDILTGEQFAPEYLKLNPNAIVPTLIHGAIVIRDSTNICEYLDDVFPENQIRPSDPD